MRKGGYGGPCPRSGIKTAEVLIGRLRRLRLRFRGGPACFISITRLLLDRLTLASSEKKAARVIAFSPKTSYLHQAHHFSRLTAINASILFSCRTQPERCCFPE